MSTNTSKKKSPAKKPSTSKKKHEAPKKQPETRETIQAPYVFTDEEVSGMERELRGHLDDIDTLKDQAKQSAQDFKLRITGHDNNVKQLRNKLGTGTETRPLEAIVSFDPKRGKKSFTHPVNGEFIREEDMSPADWQLPLFKKQEVESKKPEPQLPLSDAEKPEEPAKKTGTPKPSVPPKSSPSGKTNLGDALDKAGSETKPPTLTIDFAACDNDHVKVTRAFKKAAGVAKWSELQMSGVLRLLKECDTVEKMIATLTPFTTLDAEAPADPTGL